MSLDQNIEGAPRNLREDEAGVIYGLLVAGAGARDCEDERDCFIRYAAGQQDVEWRFQGALGFGGKLYFDGWSVPRIGCYPEDQTPARQAIIEKLNAKFRYMFTGRSALAALEGGEQP